MSKKRAGWEAQGSDVHIVRVAERFRGMLWVTERTTDQNELGGLRAAYDRSIRVSRPPSDAGQKREWWQWRGYPEQH